MSREREPVRWADPASDCDPMLRRLIEGARDGLGDAALAARIERALQERAAADSDVMELTPAAARPRMWVAWVGLAVLLLGVISAGIWARSSEPARASVSERVAPAPLSVPVEKRALAVAEDPAVARSGGTVEPTATGARPGSTGRGIAAKHSTGPQPPVRASAIAPQPGAARAASREVSAPPNTEEGGALSHSGGRTLAPEQSPIPPELSLISAAQRALRTAPAEALALADQHAQAYPSGRFSEEREEIAISAHWALGERAAARARARAFLSRYPRALAAPRIARLIDAAF